tara:strand:- start:660 stop:1046 length:387 start_codon:yes stop_codon:yes gene_type:complete
MAGKELMSINIDTLVQIVENTLTLCEQDNVQSVYKVSVKLRINKARSGDMTQILNQVRGIDGVTTVNHKADYARDTETFDFVIFEMKYELMGSDANPISYLKRTLIPGIRDIQGIDIQDIQSRPEKLS